MTKYLVSAAAAAMLGAGAFTAPALAGPDVGFSVNIGADRHHGYGYHGPHYYHSRPGVRVYTGRSSYRECETKRIVKWRNGKKIVRTIRDCD